METLLQDIRYGFRVLRKRPGFTSVVVLTLALGIGANTAIFSVVNTVLLRPLSFPESDRLVSVSQSNPSRGLEDFSVSPPNFFDWRDQNRVFSEIAAYNPNPMALTGRGEADRIVAVSASPSLFSTLNVQPALGRSFVEEEGQRGNDHEVILSYRLWQSRFGGDKAIIGKSARLDGENRTIVGVMPAGFQFPLSGSDAWIPLTFPANVATQRGAHYLNVIARLRPGTRLEQARLEMRTIAAGLEAQYPKSNKGSTASVAEFRESLVNDVRPALLILLAAVALLVLIACTNIANLLLARANERSHEVAMRAALGASPRRLVRQFLTESLLMAFLGGVAGLVLAAWGIGIIEKFGPHDIPRLDTLRLDDRVLAFAAGLSILTSLIFGLIPALKVSRGLHVQLQAGPRAVGQHENSWLRSGLVVGELALSLMLLTGAGLLMRSFLRVTGVDPGFDASHVLIFDLSLPEIRYSDGTRVEQFADNLIPRLKALPQVQSASTVFPRPLSGEVFSSSFHIKGAPAESSDQERSVYFRVVGPDYFQTMRIPVKKGRPFTSSDRRGAPAVLLLSEQGEKKFFPRGNAIGQQMTLDARIGYDKISGEIVGVVGDVHYSGLDVDPMPDVYAPFSQAGVGDMSVVVRTHGDAAGLTNTVRGQVHEVDADLPLTDIATMSDVVAVSIGKRSFYMLLLGLFAAVALLLAAVGIYGVMAYLVSRRTQEIGLRLALGAQPGRVMAMVLSESAWVVLIGVLAGVLATAAASRLLATLLFGISTGDPVTFVSSVLLLAFIALLASYVPARRATKVDPMVALRCE